jgi:hypothetical protein
VSLLKTNTETVVGTLVDANGEVINKPTELLSTEEAELLRKYKQFLQKRGLREALYCNTCWQGDLADGMDAHVTASQIVFKCAHRLLFHQGYTY